MNSKRNPIAIIIVAVLALYALNVRSERNKLKIELAAVEGELDRYKQAFSETKQALEEANQKILEANALAGGYSDMSDALDELEPVDQPEEP